METDLFNEFTKILEAFDKHAVDYVLIGGFAVVLHGFPRFTEDMDIFVDNIPGNMENREKGNFVSSQERYNSA